MIWAAAITDRYLWAGVALGIASISLTARLLWWELHNGDPTQGL